MMDKLEGIGVSPGIAIGRAFVIRKVETSLSVIVLGNDDEVSKELIRFDLAISAASDEIETIKNGATITEGELDILDIQVELISDPQLKDDVTEKINSEKKTARDALIEVTANLVAVFEGMDDVYMSARSADVKDAGSRILKHLYKTTQPASRKFGHEVIIIADDITPSETISMDFSCVRGFATRVGSKTSHTAIIAKAKGIPALVGCGDKLLTITDNDLLILDGREGRLLINPSEETVSHYRLLGEQFKQQSEKLKTLRDVPSITTDGAAITLLGNIGSADDLEAICENGGMGAGLLRTELLFMNRDTYPSEDEQFEFYKNIALSARNKPVIVRTIDIGGDKQLPYFNIPPELNPFLGYRAIRICLDKPELFLMQLKAILRASVFGDLKIMFPMIASVQELRAAKKILDEAKQILTKMQLPFKNGINVGIMVEIPSAAITADILAKEVDFFSIGTNDLCQYTLAVDRMNEKVAHLYDTYNPGILRLINNVIEQGNKHNIHVGMCGEMAGDPLATLLLMGMGLKEFSMVASSIPGIKNIIISHSELNAKQICSKVMEMDNSTDIIAYLTKVNA